MRDDGKQPRGYYVMIRGVLYPVTGKRQSQTASMILRKAGGQVANIDHWDGFEWKPTGLVLHAIGIVSSGSQPA
jgi:hypothetical protein